MDTGFVYATALAEEELLEEEDELLEVGGGTESSICSTVVGIDASLSFINVAMRSRRLTLPSIFAFSIASNQLLGMLSNAGGLLKSRSTSSIFFKLIVLIFIK